MIAADWIKGSQQTLGELGADGAFVDDGYASEHVLDVGSPVCDAVPERQEEA